MSLMMADRQRRRTMFGMGIDPMSFSDPVVHEAYLNEPVPCRYVSFDQRMGCEQMVPRRDMFDYSDGPVDSAGFYAMCCRCAGLDSDGDSPVIPCSPTPYVVPVNRDDTSDKDNSRSSAPSMLRTPETCAAPPHMVMSDAPNITPSKITQPKEKGTPMNLISNPHSPTDPELGNTRFAKIQKVIGYTSSRSNIRVNVRSKTTISRSTPSSSSSLVQEKTITTSRVAVYKRPSVSTATVLKKPTSAVLKRPAASAATVLKKPSSAVFRPAISSDSKIGSKKK